jgi:hypothetical protein
VIFWPSLLYHHIITTTTSTNQPASMAKSTRSKVKRAFRAKKRTEGVYASTEDARLHRLNAKLRALTTSRVNDDDDDDDDGQETGNPIEEGAQDEDQDVCMPGSCWFAAFGLMDHLDVSPAAMHRLGLGRRVPPYLRHSLSGHFA